MTPANTSNRAALAVHRRNRTAAMIALVATTTAVFRCRLSGVGIDPPTLPKLTSGSGDVIALLISPCGLLESSVQGKKLER
jgi:hypothetical protein